MWSLVVVPVLMLLGAAIATWLAWHQGRTFDAADAQPAPASPVAARARLSEMRHALRSGAIGGGLTGVLTTPLGVLEALGTLSDPEGVPTVDVLSELLWLLIPVAAILGLTSTRPWAKFVGGLLALFAASRSLGAAVTLLSWVLPKPYPGQTDFYILFTGAWLLMIPAGAALGVMASALWSRSPSAYGNAAPSVGGATSHRFEQAS